jgi:Fur family transcriptional regulator, ferric uptake regulator
MFDRTEPTGWRLVPDRLHARGLRWTSQRRTLVEVLSRTTGHVTGAELVERCRAVDPATTPSTVYRTLDVLEDLGYVSHHHGIDGREEFHVIPVVAHGHLHCRSCGGSWQIEPDEADAIAALFDRERSFAVDPSHVAITGRCVSCTVAEDVVVD